MMASEGSDDKPPTGLRHVTVRPENTSEGSDGRGPSGLWRVPFMVGLFVLMYLVFQFWDGALSDAVFTVLTLIALAVFVSVWVSLVNATN